MDRHSSLKRCLSIFFRCLSVIGSLLFPVFHRCRIELCLEAAGEVAGEPKPSKSEISAIWRSWRLINRVAARFSLQLRTKSFGVIPVSALNLAYSELRLSPNSLASVFISNSILLRFSSMILLTVSMNFWSIGLLASDCVSKSLCSLNFFCRMIRLRTRLLQRASNTFALKGLLI